VLTEQDDQLDDLSRAVTRTKHIAVAVHDELDLQTRLLVSLLGPCAGAACVRGAACVYAAPQDEVDEEVEETTGRLATATKRIKVLIKKSNECKMMIGLFLLVLVLGGCLVLFLKVAPMGARRCWAMCVRSISDSISPLQLDDERCNSLSDCGQVPWGLLLHCFVSSHEEPMIPRASPQSCV